MAKDDTSYNARSSYHYLHFTPDEIVRLSSAELLQACLESRGLLQIIIGILLTPDASPTERIVACDLVYTQAMRIPNEPSSDQSHELFANIKALIPQFGLPPHTA